MIIRSFRFSSLLITAVVIFQACSMDRFVIRQTATLLDYGVIALYEENDLEIAEHALASNLKLLEGMIKGDPDNEHLRILTAQAVSGYTLGFVEDRSPERAKSLYLRGRDHARHVLRMNDEYRKAEDRPLDEFTAAVNELDAEDIDAMFWTAFSWSGWINLSLDNPEAFIDLPKVQALMQRVLELDESYFFGAPHLFFGSVWGMKPAMLGGDPEKAREHFERNIELTGGKFLLTYIYYARFVAAKTLDEELFDRLLAHVGETPADVLPDYQLLNVIAKEKAERLADKKDEIF